MPVIKEFFKNKKLQMLAQQNGNSSIMLVILLETNMKA